MANPYASGEDNLRVNAEYVLDQLRRAATDGDTLRHLGAAVHAVQDSYSGAHTWRDYAVYAGDPTAAVSALHVFALFGSTHHSEFDKPPAGSGTARAAVEATYRILAAYEEARGDPSRADAVLRAAVEPLFRAATGGVRVCLRADERWRAERDDRLELDKTPGQRASPG
ncbi:hypothetical protein [Kribbella sp. NPDC051770]|uniref:hypothetical protein n=1 Tax=Kribbella sp. NPDC051770 TaxID=3155413 RepID=UPI003431BD34